MITLVKKMIGLSFLMMIVFETTGQTNEMDSTSVAASMELVKLQNAVEAYDGMQFDMEAIATEGGLSDTLTGIYYLKGDLYKAVFDSMVQIQNQYLNVEVHESGKLLIVSKPMSFSKQFLKGNIDDGLFTQMNVASINITTAGADKIISFNFLPESDYDTYTITYNASNYRVSESYIKTKVADENGDFISGQFSTLRIRFLNFTPISGSTSFDTEQYVYSTGGSGFEKKSAYSDYELINMFQEQ
jgi:hypothetical protein